MKDTDENQPVDSIEEDILSAIDSIAEEVADENKEEQSPDVEDEPSENEVDETTELDDDSLNEEEASEGGLNSDDSPEIDAVGEVDDDPNPNGSADNTALEAPEHWEASHKEIFNNQTQEGKEFLLERHKSMEGHFTRRMQEIAPIQRQYDAIQDALAPFQQEFAQAGLDQAGAVRQLASWHTALRNNGKEAVIQLANTYGIDMTTEEDFVDPAVQSLQNKIRELETHNNNQVTQAQQAKQTELLNTIQAFETETDGSGKLVNPHFQLLSDDITRLYSAGIVNNLKDGYTMALSKRPDLTPPKEPEKVIDINKDRAEKVKKAKKAATGVKSSTASKQRSEMTLEEEIASHLN